MGEDVNPTAFDDYQDSGPEGQHKHEDPSLYWALESECEILVFVWSCGQQLARSGSWRESPGPFSPVPGKKVPTAVAITPKEE